MPRDATSPSVPTAETLAQIFGTPLTRLTPRTAGEMSMGHVQDRIKRLASLARLGFDEVAIDPPWHELDEARSVIAECLGAVG